MAHLPVLILSHPSAINKKGCVFVSNSNSESFRNEFIARLLQTVPQAQAMQVISVLDETMQAYDVQPKPVAIVPTDGIPEAVKHFLASKAIQNLSQGTLHIYHLRLTDFFTVIRKPCTDISADDIRKYLFFYKTEHHASGSYLDAIRRILNSFFAWAMDNQLILRNPCATVEHIHYQQAERKPLSSYDLEVLRWHCKTLREKALVDFLFSTGVRISELHDLNRSDICFESRSAVIQHGKGDKRRMVYFNAESELSLRKYLESRQDDDPALFVTDRNPHRRLCKKGLENTITKIAERAGLHVYPHKLRHTFATYGIRSGMPIEKLQALMGHSKPETTLIYAKLCDTDLRMEHARVYA